MKVVESASKLFLYGNDMKAYDKIPAGTYDICYSEMGGFYLSRRQDMVINEKVYGVQSSKVDKVLNSFKVFNRNLGVILSGNKGIGKSLTAKMISIEAVKQGYPVILANRYINGIASFIESIDQEVAVLFDEFDKTFKSRDNESPQDTMLSLFDGTSAGKKLFIVTCNRLNDLNDYLVNRPGRFHYHFRFDYPGADEVETYLKDKLEEKYYDQIPAVVDFSGKIDLNYDCLRSIAFELNLGTTFAEAIKDLNIINMNETNYKLTVLFKDGYHTSCTKRLDLFNGAQRVSFDAKLKDNFWTDFYINTEDIQYNPANGEQFIDGRKVCVVNPYDENEKDRYEAFEKDNGVVKVVVSRARERDIHYMV